MLLLKQAYPYLRLYILANLGCSQKIVVEIKSFRGRSPMRELETALGQYLIYRTFLSVTHPDYQIYLAIARTIYEEFFTQAAIRLILREYQVFLLIVDIDREEIIQWIS